MSIASRRFGSATDRWAGVGPYYAMFPVRFADEVIQRYTQPGDTVLDPFAGRGTSVFSAASQGRTGIGIEMNPVGWVYAQAKIRPASEDSVITRIEELAGHAYRYRRSATQLPPFFHYCFSPSVQRFLLAARKRLDWRHSIVDWTTAAIILIYLHGKRSASLSNQMRQTKSLSPEYAIRWWQDHGLDPPDLDPAKFLIQRVIWRYAKGRPLCAASRMYLGDSVELLARVQRWVRSAGVRPVQLLFTSPPYFGLTHYHYDQWLRLWLLGGPPDSVKMGGKYRGRFENRNEYRELLHRVFTRSKKILSSSAIVYIRTSKQQFTLDTTLAVLRELFPDKGLRLELQPFVNPTQTQLFGDRSIKEGEVDVVLG